MKFIHYFNLSLLGTAALVGYAFYSREQFYPIVLFLVTNKISFVVAGNMMLATALLLGNVSKTLFLGQLRDVEIEMLTERAKYTITETCLALTIFRNELTPNILGLFGMLLFLKAFHWLAKSRLEHLEQVMPVGYITHCRLSLLIVVLAAADMALAHNCMAYTLEFGKSVLILFSFEFGLLVISIFNLCNRYFLYNLDSRLPNGLASKTLYVMIVDLVCDALRFVTYVIFFSLVFVYYGMPIHLIRELWMSFHTLQRHLVSFIKYLRLTNNLDQRFADASPEEVEACGDCLICRERIERGKKLPCSHVFHLECLRMWLQHQQSCPLCRADIPITATPMAVAANANANAAGGAAGGVAADVAAAAPAGEEGGGGGAGEEAPVWGVLRGPGVGATAHPPVAVAAGASEAPAAALPAFYLVVAPSMAVRASASSAASVLRTIASGLVVFVSARETTVEGVWLRVPDGWVFEGSAENPLVVPYVPPPEPLARRFQSPLLPQPSVGYASGAGSSAGARTPGASIHSGVGGAPGGSRSSASASGGLQQPRARPSSRSRGADSTTTLRVRDPNGGETTFKLPRDARMTDVFKLYAHLKGLAPRCLRFLLAGRRIRPDDTPRSLGLDEASLLDVMHVFDPDSLDSPAGPDSPAPTTPRSVFGVPFSGPMSVEQPLSPRQSRSVLSSGAVKLQSSRSLQAAAVDSSSMSLSAIITLQVCLSLVQAMLILACR